MNVHGELEKFILTELAIDHDLESITSDIDLLMQGIIDSMGVVKLTAFIEEKFGIKVNDLDVIPENFQNIESITNFVNSRIRVHFK